MSCFSICVTPLFYICFRILLTVVAVLSSYSIHLLLKSSGVVGASISWISLRSLGPLSPWRVRRTCTVSTFTCKVSSCVCGSGIRAYEQLGYRAFGTPGKMAAGIAITLQNIGGEVTPAICPRAWILGWCLSCRVTTEHQPQYILI